MPSGDANRIWFPELVDILQARWHEEMPVDELIQLTAELDAALQAIRAERRIKSAMMWCPNCQKRHRSAPPRVSVPATIFALSRFGVASPETVKSTEKRWKRHRRENQLDLYGASGSKGKPRHDHDG
jgi:hypothetical protein